MFYFLAALLALLMGGGDPASAIPEPIDPGSGELNLLELVEDLPINEIDTALDNFPVPYVVVAQAGSGPPVIENKNAGSPIRIDADSSMATGKGGNDIEVEVNTELGPPRLELEINRLGNAPFATDLEVLVAFPFDAFNDEVLPGAPNLFFGYETTGPDGVDGGFAPLSEVFTFTPDVLAGTTHTFQLEMDTTGASNPLRFQAGAFDGDNLVGILDAAAMSAHVEPVPAEITLGLTVDESALADPGVTSSLFDLSWEATAPSKVVFDYLEEETPPGGPVTDYNTTLTVDQMPTGEHLSVGLDELAGTLVLSHDASDPIDEVTLLPGDLERSLRARRALPDGPETTPLDVRLALAQEQVEEARRPLAELAARARSVQDRISVALLEARAHLVDDESAALASLVRAIDRGRPEGFVLVFTEDLPALKGLMGWLVAETDDPYLFGLLAALAQMDGPSPVEFDLPADPLSTREQVVLRFLPTSLPYKEIARELHVSVNTLKTHLKSINRKLGTGSRAETVAAARARQLL